MRMNGKKKKNVTYLSTGCGSTHFVCFCRIQGIGTSRDSDSRSCFQPILRYQNDPRPLACKVGLIVLCELYFGRDRLQRKHDT